MTSDSKAVEEKAKPADVAEKTPRPKAAGGSSFSHETRVGLTVAGSFAVLIGGVFGVKKIVGADPDYIENPRTVVAPASAPFPDHPRDIQNPTAKPADPGLPDQPLKPSPLIDVNAFTPPPVPTPAASLNMPALPTPPAFVAEAVPPYPATVPQPPARNAITAPPAPLPTGLTDMDFPPVPPVPRDGMKDPRIALTKHEEPPVLAPPITPIAPKDQPSGASLPGIPEPSSAPAMKIEVPMQPKAGELKPELPKGGNEMPPLGGLDIPAPAKPNGVPALPLAGTGAARAETKDLPGFEMPPLSIPAAEGGRTDNGAKPKPAGEPSGVRPPATTSPLDVPPLAPPINDGSRAGSAEIKPVPPINLEPAPLRPQPNGDFGKRNEDKATPKEEGARLLIKVPARTMENREPGTIPVETAIRRNPSTGSKDYDEDVHKRQVDENFGQISKKYYNDASYGRALEEYNTAHKTYNGTVLVPPIWVLEEQHAKAMPATGTIRTTSMTTPAPARADFAPPRAAAPAPVREEVRNNPFAGLNVYTVKRGGETLQNIAQKQLGSAGSWRSIKDYNIAVDESAELAIGTRLYLPPGSGPKSNRGPPAASIRVAVAIRIGRLHFVSHFCKNAYHRG